MGIKFSQLPIASSVSSDDYIAVLDSSENVLRRTTVDHASQGTSYGLGTCTEYGHNKVIDDLLHSTFNDGESLSARQGNIIATNLGYIEKTNVAAHPHMIDDYFLFLNQFVKCTDNIAAGDRISLGYNVIGTDISTVLSEMNSTLAMLNSIKCDIINLATAYDINATYIVGNLCTYLGRLYRCISPIEDPGPFNDACWQQITTTDAYSKSFKLISSVSGDSVMTVSEMLDRLMVNVDVAALTGAHNIRLVITRSNGAVATLHTAGYDPALSTISFNDSSLDSDAKAYITTIKLKTSNSESRYCIISNGSFTYRDRSSDLSEIGEHYDLYISI